MYTTSELKCVAQLQATFLGAPCLHPLDLGHHIGQSLSSWPQSLCSYK
jgi:hypothetical protein